MLPIQFKNSKTLNDRLKDYITLQSESRDCKDIEHFWSEQLYFALGNHRWRAIWVFSEINCTKFQTLYPTAVEVNVTEVEFDELSAVVVVEGPHSIIDLPGILSVPILELYPLQEHDQSHAIINGIADGIDRCRYFYNKLWYPWDRVEDMCLSKWAELHLESRLELQNSMENKILDHVAADHVSSLISEAWARDDSSENDTQTDTVEEKLMSVQNIMRMENIKLELSLFENPEMRECMIRRLHEKKNVIDYNSPIAFVTFESSLSVFCEVHKLLLTAVSQDSIVRLYSNAQSAVEGVKPGTTVILSPGSHGISDLGNLAYAGHLRGLGEPSEVKLTPKDLLLPRILFLRSIGPLLIEGVTIERKGGVLITVVDRLLRIKNCILRSADDQLSTGVQVRRGCRLEMTDCQIEGFSTGVILDSSASAILDNCHIKSCVLGVKVKTKSSLSLKSGSITDCFSTAVLFEANDGVEPAEGEIEMLTDATQVDASVFESGCSFQRNKIDAAIKIFPIYE